MRDYAKSSIHVTCLLVLCLLALPHVLALDVAEFKCPQGYVLISDCVEKRHLKVQLIGDGQNTSSCKLLLTDPLTGKTASTVIRTVCASKKSMTAPPDQATADEKKLQWKITNSPPKGVLEVVQAAKSLSTSGAYNNVPLPQERKLATISQMAVWKNLAGTHPPAKDAISSKTIENDLLTKSHVDPKDLTTDEKKELDRRVDAIFEAVDLTCKVATTTPPPQTPKSPEAPGTPMQPEVPQTPGESTTGGDGTESDHCCAPTGTTFVPDNNDFQTMMCVTDTLVNCPGDKGSDGSTTQSDDNDKDEVPRTTEKPKEPGEAPKPKTVVNAEGVSITTELHPNGKIKSITKEHPPTKGGDPKDPTSESHKTTSTEYADDKRRIKKTTEKVEIRTLQGPNEEKTPKKVTTTEREYSDPTEKTPSFVEKETVTVEEVSEIDDNGLTHINKTTTTKTFSGPKDTEGKTEQKKETYDPNKDKWSPAK